MDVLPHQGVLNYGNADFGQSQLHLVEMLLLNLREQVKIVDVLLFFQYPQHFFPSLLIGFESEAFLSLFDLYFLL